MTTLRSGADGEPVLLECHVVRMGGLTKALNEEAVQRLLAGKAHESMFALSEEEREQKPPRLSVWVEELTTLTQAWQLTGEKPHKRFALFLPIPAVRGMKPEQPEPPHTGLDVVWEPATVPSEDGQRVPDTRPGADGHAGIARLEEGTKGQRKSFRSQLADLARVQELSPDQMVSAAG